MHNCSPQRLLRPFHTGPVVALTWVVSCFHDGEYAEALCHFVASHLCRTLSLDGCFLTGFRCHDLSVRYHLIHKSSFVGGSVLVMIVKVIVAFGNHW